MCFAAVGGLVLSSEDESRTRDAVASKKRPSTLRRRLLRDAATRSAVICGSVRSGQFAKKCKIGPRASRILRTKKGLRRASQILSVLEKGLVSAKTIKQVFSGVASAELILTAYLPARGRQCRRGPLQPCYKRQRLLWLRAQPAAPHQLRAFKSRIAQCDGDERR